MQIRSIPLDSVWDLIRVIRAVCCSLTMGQLYDKEKDEDGFLYVAYSGENTFGYKAFYTTQG